MCNNATRLEASSATIALRFRATVTLGVVGELTISKFGGRNSGVRSTLAGGVLEALALTGSHALRQAPRVAAQCVSSPVALHHAIVSVRCCRNLMRSVISSLLLPSKAPGLPVDMPSTHCCPAGRAKSYSPIPDGETTKCSSSMPGRNSRQYSPAIVPSGNTSRP